VISEYYPTASPRKGTFPRRNRIIAALGDATVLIEAPRRSGALSTANHALKLGRPVLVAPGRIGDWSVAGSLALLRETPAQPLVGIDEMVEDLGFLRPPDTCAETRTVPVERLLETLGPAERTLATRLLSGPASLDGLVADTGLPPAVVSSAVTLLLMRGWAHSVGPAYCVAGALAR
jgi:DNA processing protein